MIILVVFDLTWKVRFFSAKKDVLKQLCAQDGMLQSRSQRLLFGKKVGNIGPFLTNFIHRLEHRSWCRQHLCLHKKRLQNEDKAFCFTARYFYINYSKQVMLLFNDKHFFSLKKCYLDTIGKLKLGHRLGRYR